MTQHKLGSNVITQWAMTNHMLFRLYYITGAQSIFLGYTTPSTRLVANLCDNNRVTYTKYFFYMQLHWGSYERTF